MDKNNSPIKLTTNYLSPPNKIAEASLLLLGALNITCIGILSFDILSIKSWYFFFVFLPLILIMSLEKIDLKKTSVLDWKVEACAILFVNLQGIWMIFKLSNDAKYVSFSDEFFIATIVGFFYRGLFMSQKK